MTEEQRRQQIMLARQQDLNRPAAQSMSDADAERIASQSQGLTQEQMIAIAMLGKMVSNDLGGIKKNSIGDSLNVTDVDMSKVMPSGIAKAMGIQPQRQAPVYQQPVIPAPIPQAAPQPVIQPDFQFLAQPVQQPQVINQPPSDPNQLEFDLDKQAQMNDILNELQSLRQQMNHFNEIAQQTLAILKDSNINKKKLKVTNGTQPG
jgi:hypothetical protein